MCSSFAVHREKYARNSGSKVEDPLKKVNHTSIRIMRSLIIN